MCSHKQSDESKITYTQSAVVQSTVLINSSFMLGPTAEGALAQVLVALYGGQDDVQCGDYGLCAALPTLQHAAVL
jgi:hypothetical protein